MGVLDQALPSRWSRPGSSQAVGIQSQARNGRFGIEGRANRAPRRAWGRPVPFVRTLSAHHEFRILRRRLLDLRGSGLRTLVEREQPRWVRGRSYRPRSEEHTSELQSLMRISYAVFCLKKKK